MAVGEADDFVGVFNFDFTGGELFVVDGALGISSGSDFDVFDFDLLAGLGEVGVVNEDEDPIVGSAVVFVKILFDAESLVDVRRSVECWEDHVARRDGGAAAGSVGSEGDGSSDGCATGGAEFDLVTSAVPNFSNKLILGTGNEARASNVIRDASVSGDF